MLALKKAVPSMEGGFIINTRRGDLAFHGDEAKAFAAIIDQPCPPFLAPKRDGSGWSQTLTCSKAGTKE